MSDVGSASNARCEVPGVPPGLAGGCWALKGLQSSGSEPAGAVARLVTQSPRRRPRPAFPATFPTAPPRGPSAEGTPHTPVHTRGTGPWETFPVSTNAEEPNPRASLPPAGGRLVDGTSLGSLSPPQSAKTSIGQGWQGSSSPRGPPPHPPIAGDPGEQPGACRA